MRGRTANRLKVVIIGGGFAGLRAAKSLRSPAVQVTLLDRRNHHVFQPLLYQVATGLLSPANIATPLRSVFRRQRNVEVFLEEVVDFDLVGKVVRWAVGRNAPDVRRARNTVLGRRSVTNS